MSKAPLRQKLLQIHILIPEVLYPSMFVGSHSY